MSLILFKEYTGKEFNKKMGRRKLFRFTNFKENHNEFQYKDGLNVDFLPFDPSGSGQPGGLYFVDEDKIESYLGMIIFCFHWIRKVTIPDDARVYVDKYKYKADKIILAPRKKIDSSWKNIRSKYPNTFRANMLCSFLWAMLALFFVCAHVFRFVYSI